MEVTHGLTLQKSSKDHEVEGKSWGLKRKPGEFKDSFMHWRNGDAIEIKFNAFCDEHDLEKEKVAIEEVDASTKVLPN